jgi:hypothetical protein
MVKKSSPARKRKKSRGMFDSVRKPLAPPGHPMTLAKPDEKARPAGRKAKHKQKPEVAYDPEDL